MIEHGNFCQHMCIVPNHCPGTNYCEGCYRILKSTEQGAATTVWAAISAEWKNKGGKYLENCAEAAPYEDGPSRIASPGYAPHAYNQAGAEQLWVLSEKLVGV